MKTYLSALLIFLPVLASAKPTVVVTYYDPFGKAKFNNSERVALEVQKRILANGSKINLKLCKLNTVFDKAFAQTEDCIKEMNVKPDLVLGLGEAFCYTKIETIVENRDHTFGPDNDGNERKNEVIIPEASTKLGLNYPIEKMYCGLEKRLRKEVRISTSAGSFVCNNTAFQMSYFYPETSHGFIHVPSNNCRDVAKTTPKAIEAVEQIILNSAYYLDADLKRLPTDKKSIKARIGDALTSCEKNFFKDMKIKDKASL